MEFAFAVVSFVAVIRVVTRHALHMQWHISSFFLIHLDFWDGTLNPLTYKHTRLCSATIFLPLTRKTR